MIRGALADLGPAYARRSLKAGIGLPTFLGINARVGATREGKGACDPTPHGYRVSLTLPVAPEMPAVRHLLAHELSHVLIDRPLRSASPNKGLIDEYLAERIAWEIIAEAGLVPGSDVLISNQRPAQLHWLRPLVAIATRLAATTSRARVTRGKTAYRRDQNWLWEIAYGLTRGEVYALGTEHALGIATAFGSDDGHRPGAEAHRRKSSRGRRRRRGAQRIRCACRDGDG